MSPLPPWIVFHVPHDSAEIPVQVRDQFVLSDVQRQEEVLNSGTRH